MQIRPTEAADIPALQSVLDTTELFPSEMLPDMIAGFLGPGASEDLWLTALVDGAAIGFCYARPEMLAEGTWNMLAIAVHSDQQGSGAGTGLTRQLETTLRDLGARIVIVDTSSSDDFAVTRRFYANNGYTKEARIRDFWGPGDDKIIYRKALSS